MGRIIVIGSTAKIGTNAGMGMYVTKINVKVCRILTMFRFMNDAIGPYAATKVAVEVLANTLAQELGSKGITVNTIHPGGTDTDVCYYTHALLVYGMLP
jgi:NAD(P)-dependent dehydrogenase (short-subunit alcohol dehydrogenase family)